MNLEGPMQDIVLPPRGRPYACPCCRYLTLDERGASEICQVCFWEDDGQGDQDADRVRGGPNGRESLTDARERFNEHGSSNEAQFTRAPLPYPGERHDL
ncbi:MAG: hypothetical protein QOI21_2527 [Actinomycetota bacterium]|jgi:hypothetical protein|nr:hypothetical protein [Actinomycetota bacterium]